MICFYKPLFLLFKCQQKLELIQKLETNMMKTENELEDIRKILQNERIQSSNQICNLEKEINRYQANSNQQNEAVY
jgi:hypothetical protein